MMRAWKAAVCAILFAIPLISCVADEPAFPTGAVSPTEPAFSTGPASPTEPAFPTGPAFPTEPVSPTEPASSTEPTSSTEPDAWTAPDFWTDPTYAAYDQNAFVTLREIGGESYLFLPSTADLTALTLYFEGGPVKLTAGGQTITVTCGQPFDLAALYSEAPGNGVYAFTFRADSDPLRVKLMVSQNIGAMYITSDDPVSKGRSFVEQAKENKATGRMTLIGADGGVVYSGALTQIKGRGNSTWNYMKKPYQIKLGKKTDLLQTGDPDEAAKTWVLLANAYDSSFILNTLTFDLADALGLPYSPNSRPIDLYYDGEYRGTYLLSEKTEINGGRVDINDLEEDFEDANPQVEDFDGLPTAMGANRYGNTYRYVTGLTDPEDLSGGYLLEIDYASRAYAEKSWFAAGQRMDIVVWPYAGTGFSAGTVRNFISRRNEYLHGLYHSEAA